MKLHPISDSAWQSAENVKDLDEIVEARWKNITKALGIKANRRSYARKTQT